MDTDRLYIYFGNASVPSVLVRLSARNMNQPLQIYSRHQQSGDPLTNQNRSAALPKAQLGAMCTLELQAVQYRAAIMRSRFCARLT